MRVFVNGFGRIGRTVTRILLENKKLVLAGINDIVDDVDNLAYLLNYDSNYGRLATPARALAEEKALTVDGHKIPVFNCREIDALPWQEIDADIVIDCSGTKDNVLAAHSLRGKGKLKGVVVTHSPKDGIDRHIIMGVNEAQYDSEADFVVSSSICDANAIAHLLKFVDDAYGIEHGSVTTLHPWLGYQNLTDAAVVGQSDPGHYWPDYSLGRSSVGMLIPKNTTAVSATEPVLGDLAGRLQSFSYRIPTSVVTSADLTLITQRDVSQEKLEQDLTSTFSRSPYIELNRESLVSADYEKNPHSAIVDMQWAKAGPGNMIKLILWYDNEWGYACRAIDTACHILEQQQGNGQK
ncbi:glyceraldehyde 3-phosphate dehydrogenase NAD-binding domain-containing protein [Kordiimonas sp.]|uniref:glyceraldehyde 3-phosphate dehydrogenase NAD-binding domain-containing protein n=1 Tax=Kordiimonas sp. TaxID=1970157 RepID=UPI003A92E0A7